MSQTSSHTNASLTFLVPDPLHKIEKPYECLYEPIDGLKRSNYDVNAVNNISVHDIRPQKGLLSLDRDGFLVADLHSSMALEDYGDIRKLKEIYAEELRGFLTELLGARAVYFHETLIRKRIPSFPAAKASIEGYGQPIPITHTDYTLNEVSKLIGQLFGEKADDIRKTRFQMLNVWKPLRGPLRDWPLALCQLESVDDKDLVPIDEVHVGDILESHQIYYNPEQKWCYLKDQLPSELLIFKAADSKIKGAVPHGSFCHPDYPNENIRRESIESRIIVVY